MTQEEFDFWSTHDLDKLKDLLEEEALSVGAEIENYYLVKAGELMLAGWKPEYQRLDMACMAWSWRRPKKLPWTKGKLFHSTNQAWNAMVKERDA